ncbi:hypothetical protein L484_009878 [Morus notabilis]|uniref:Plasma membrane-associated cation-binding protein 1 n=1 Tax=Morus notabilis TaxID=981085 RepID=W9R4W0_9ROSA|nr:plasma membrane-associated cation-binding protein 1 [Morus notabilis]XP_024020156.1 plasma membrane-associated cation-binding protein 1 [Morus notabilis]EXB56452.1 hypothetical protein L484_009878 [Morus notabilis]
MGYWKSKVLPKIKKVFDKNGPKKAAAAEAVKSFDDSKEEINKQFEEKKDELQPKVLEIYEASSTEIKSFVKEPKEAGLKKNSAAVHQFLEELVKIEFPGSKQVTEASSKYGPALVSGPVLFVFEKFSTFIVTEEVVVEKEVKTTAEEGEKEAPKTTTEEAPASSKEKEIVVEEEKEEIVVEKKEEKKKEEEPPKPSEEAAAAEPPKADEAAAAAPSR